MRFPWSPKPEPELLPPEPEPARELVPLPPFQPAEAQVVSCDAHIVANTLYRVQAIIRDAEQRVHEERDPHAEHRQLVVWAGANLCALHGHGLLDDPQFDALWARLKQVA